MSRSYHKVWESPRCQKSILKPQPWSFSRLWDSGLSMEGCIYIYVCTYKIHWYTSHKCEYICIYMFYAWLFLDNVSPSFFSYKTRIFLDPFVQAFLMMRHLCSRSLRRELLGQGFFSWLANGSCPCMILFNTSQVCRFEMKHEQIECLGVDSSCFVGVHDFMT